MKYLQLLHSYNFVNSSFILKNNNLYDNNNNLLLKIINIPKNSSLYKIKIEKILQKKIFSKKKNKSYYTKHNIKIYLLVNYNILNDLILNNLIIPDKKILFNIILSNQKLINENLVENLCINKNFFKKINLLKTTTFNNSFNYINFNKIYFNLKNKDITHKINYKYFTLKGGFIYYDILFLFIEDILNYLTLNNLLNNSLVVIDNSIKKYINPKLNILNIDNKYSLKKTKYKIIIFLTDFDVTKFKYDYIWICKNNNSLGLANDFLNNLNKYFNINLMKDNLNEKLLYQLKNIISFYCYKELLIKKNILKINTIKFNNNNNFDEYNYKFIKKDKSKCCICFMNDNDIVTSCNHLFCGSCIKHLLNENFKCPLCRENLNKKKIFKIFDEKTICDKIKFIINKKSIKNKMILCNSNQKHKLNMILEKLKFKSIVLNNYSNSFPIQNIFIFEKNKINEILNNIKKYKKINIYLLIN